MRGSTPENPALLLTPPQAAKALAISERKLWSMTAAGEIPSLKMGRSVRYSVDDLRRWIAEESNGGAA